MSQRTLRAIVTGADGFIGSALLRAAPAAGVSARGVARRAAAGILDTDYTPGSLATIIDASGASMVVHAAGPASVAASMADPGADFSASVVLTAHVLEAARRSASRPRVLLVSSAAVYGNPATLPVAEHAPVAPISAYGFHKAACEQLVREYASCFEVDGAALRVFSVFGEAQRRLLVWELVQRHREAPQVELVGTGDEERDYLHVDDLAMLLWRCAKAGLGGGAVVNLASGTSIRVRELAERIGAALGSNKRIVCLGKRNPVDPVAWRADVSMLHGLIGDPGLPSLEQRLQQVVEDWSR